MKEKYLLKWGEKYSTLLLDIFERVVISHPNIIGNNIADYLSYVKDRKLVKAYYGEKAAIQIQKRHGEYFLKKNRIKKLISDYDRIISQYDKLISGYNAYDYKKLSNRKLYLLFKKYISFSEKALAYFRLTREEGEIGPTEKIKAVLQKYYREDEINEVFQIVTQSPEIDIIGEERIAWFKIIENGWDERKIRKYVIRFAANFVNMYDIGLILKYLEKRYAEDKDDLKNIKNEIKRNKRQKINNRLKQQSVYKRCQHNRDLIVFSKMLQKFGVYRFKLKYCWAGAELRLLTFFDEIVKRMKVSLSDFFDLYLVDDVFNYFENGTALSKKQIEERKRCILIHVKDKKYKAYFGDRAIRIIKQIERQEKRKTDLLEGTVAFPGHVSGKVKIVHATDIEKMHEIAKDFKDGDILVSENTQPAMIVLMKKSLAILTEQGGITSHASIVSREFKKPCIVGIMGLLKVLKDGDLVEVDADRGIVRILKND